jgi:hypothetical protein
MKERGKACFDAVNRRRIELIRAGSPLTLEESTELQLVQDFCRAWVNLFHPKVVSRDVCRVMVFEGGQAKVSFLSHSDKQLL